MRRIWETVHRIAPRTCNVLITGESGVGKEVLARAIHTTSDRRDRPFVPINCAAMPEGLLESELFGHVRGAFTGAHADKSGLFLEAEGGILFLDEIGDMSPVLQGKLLRTLQDGEVRPVGGQTATRVDVRIVAATHQDLDRQMASGRFRQDLFYRLNVVPIHVPALRERREDIPGIAQDFLERHGGGASYELAPETERRLCAHAWPGNARELENAIERAIALSTASELGPELFELEPERANEAGHGVPMGAPAAPSDCDAALDVLARAGLDLEAVADRFVDRVLALQDGNKQRAAEALGIARATLYRRLGRR